MNENQLQSIFLIQQLFVCVCVIRQQVQYIWVLVMYFINADRNEELKCVCATACLETHSVRLPPRST